MPLRLDERRDGALVPGVAHVAEPCGGNAVYASSTLGLTLPGKNDAGEGQFM
jgi:hypothetical protein